MDTLLELLPVHLRILCLRVKAGRRIRAGAVNLAIVMEPFGSMNHGLIGHEPAFHGRRISTFSVLEWFPIPRLQDQHPWTIVVSLFQGFKVVTHLSNVMVGQSAVP